MFINVSSNYLIVNFCIIKKTVIYTINELINLFMNIFENNCFYGLINSIKNTLQKYDIPVGLSKFVFSIFGRGKIFCIHPSVRSEP